MTQTVKNFRELINGAKVEYVFAQSSNGVIYALKYDSILPMLNDYKFGAILIAENQEGKSLQFAIDPDEYDKASCTNGRGKLIVNPLQMYENAVERFEENKK